MVEIRYGAGATALPTLHRSDDESPLARAMGRDYMRLHPHATLLFTLALVLASLFDVFTASPALARSDCNNGALAGTADIAVTQIISVINASTDLSDDVQLTNLGPCNVPAASLRVTLPAGAAYVGFSSNPNAWTCAETTPGTIDCSEQNTIGVPGTADIYIRYTPGTGPTVIACGSGGTDTQHCPAAAPATPPDANPSNNISYAGLVGAGGTVTYGPNGDSTPRSFFDHTTSVTLANGGLVNIYHGAFCPSDVPDCFLGTITVDTNANGSKTWTLSFLASLAGKKSLSQITIWNSFGGPFTALTSCNSKHASDPCVQDRVRSTNSDGDTVYTITVVGTNDNGMTAD